MRLCHGVGHRDKDLLMRLSILDVKHLHAVRRKERVWCHTRREGAGGIEVKVGPVIVIMLPRKAESLVEELVEDIHVGKVWEVGPTTIANVRHHLVEHCSVFRRRQAFIGKVICFEILDRNACSFGAFQLSGFVKVVNQGRIGFIEKASECKAKKDLGAVDSGVYQSEAVVQEAQISGVYLKWNYM